MRIPRSGPNLGPNLGLHLGLNLGLALVLALVLALGLAGCSLGGSRTAAGSGPSGPPVLLFDRSGRDYAAFTSPTGNISCGFAAAAGAQHAPTVSCEIIVKDWMPTAQPSSCNRDWGSGVILADRAALLCAADQVRVDGASVVLPYNTSIRFSPFTCTSQTSGVQCLNRTSGAAFTLTRAHYVLKNP